MYTSFLQDRKKRGEVVPDVFLGDVYAYRQRFQEAARLYKNASEEQKAMDMYTDLRMFEYAKVITFLFICPWSYPHDSKISLWI